MSVKHARIQCICLFGMIVQGSVGRGWTHLISEEFRFLDHHPHFCAGVRDAFDFEGAVVPLGEEAVGFFEFAPEEEGF